MSTSLSVRTQQAIINTGRTWRSSWIIFSVAWFLILPGADPVSPTATLRACSKATAILTVIAAFRPGFLLRLWAESNVASCSTLLSCILAVCNGSVTANNPIAAFVTSVAGGSGIASQSRSLMEYKSTESCSLV